mmetsp:Transcript_6760/g.15697  ORF Transcript_6760/g.15697 Transcript_6760/m.15697 type:complete len:498 (-) Transcript_6760:49-1542(-)
MTEAEAGFQEKIPREFLTEGKAKRPRKESRAKGASPSQPGTTQNDEDPRPKEPVQEEGPKQFRRTSRAAVPKASESVGWPSACGILYHVTKVLLVLALVMFGLWALQLWKQQHEAERFLLRQDKLQKRLHQELVAMRKEKTALLMKTRDVQAEEERRTDEMERQAKKMLKSEQKRALGLEETVSQRDDIIHGLQRALQEKNISEARLVSALRADTAAVKEAAEKEVSQAALADSQAKAVQRKEQQVQQGQRQILELHQNLVEMRQNLEDTRKKLEASRAEQQTLEERLQAQTDKQKLTQKLADDSVAASQEKLDASLAASQEKLEASQKQLAAMRQKLESERQAGEAAKQEVEKELETERETWQVSKLHAEEELKTKSKEVKKLAGQAVSKLQGEVDLQSELVQSLLGQLHQRTRERNEGEVRLNQLRTKLRRQELRDLETRHVAIQKRLAELGGEPEAEEDQEEDLGEDIVGPEEAASERKPRRRRRSLRLPALQG